MSELIAKTNVYDPNKKHIKTNEFVLYLVAVFFYTMMTGTVGSYRNKFLVDILKINENHISLFNILVAVIPFILNIFITMYIDGRKVGKSGKFRPLALLVAIPTGIFLVLSFWAPSVLVDGYGTSKLVTTLLMIYLTTVAVAWAVCTNFGDSVNKVAIVMTPSVLSRRARHARQTCAYFSQDIPDNTRRGRRYRRHSRNRFILLHPH